MANIVNPVVNARVYELTDDVKNRLANKVFAIFNETTIHSNESEISNLQEAIYYSSDEKYCLTMTKQDFISYYNYVKISKFQDANFGYEANLYIEMLIKNNIDGFRPVKRGFAYPDFVKQGIQRFHLDEGVLWIDVLFNLNEARNEGAEVTILWGLKINSSDELEQTNFFGTAHFTNEGVEK